MFNTDVEVFDAVLVIIFKAFHGRQHLLSKLHPQDFELYFICLMLVLIGHILKPHL